MTRQLAGLLLLGLLMFASGCAMCASPFDSHYAAYGGAWDRADPSQGRVGSVFHPGGVTVQSTAAAESADGVPPGEADEAGQDDRSILAPADSAPSAEDAPPTLAPLLNE